MRQAAIILVFYLIYMAAAWACLWQWRGPRAAARIDLFSGGFFALAPLWMAESLLFIARIGGGETRDEASGDVFDPTMSRLIPILALGDLAVFLDYGHWRLAPALIQPVPQSLGLVLWAVTPLWLLWADRHLLRHFSQPGWAGRLVTDGPYGLVRHPRYAGLLVSRLAFALLLGSVLAWVLGIGWALVVGRRIRLEERHLRFRHGDRYDDYASRTARLLPGVY